MKAVPQSTDALSSETRALYLHLLNLKKEDGEPATDRAWLNREIAESPELREGRVDAATLAKYASGDQEIAADHLADLRVALDRALRKAVDPRLTWKPRWLNAPQGIRHAPPSISSHALRHHPLGS